MIDISNWKKLDIAAKNTQLAALRKMLLDPSFRDVESQILMLIESRTKELMMNIINLYDREVRGLP